MNAHLLRVESDLYFISSRIKEVDDTYYVVYNVRMKRYEVHSDAQRGGSLCFVVPYKTLDARTVEYARCTRNPNFCKSGSARSIGAKETNKW